MRWGLLMAAMAMMPLYAAGAEDMPAGAKDWHLCVTDFDCVVVPGICGEAAVNLSVKSEATNWYQEKKRTTRCPDTFWKPKTGMARCRLQNCEVAM